MNSKTKLNLVAPTAIFGTRVHSGNPLIPQSPHYCVMELGWMEIIFGKSQYGVPVIFADNGEHFFLLSEAPPEQFTAPNVGDTEWIFEIHALRDSLLGKMLPHSIQTVYGITITEGLDDAGAAFVIVDLPDGFATILIRDPKSMSGNSWANEGVTPVLHRQRFDPPISLTKKGVHLKLVA
jgi:hypothetical protein